MLTNVSYHRFNISLRYFIPCEVKHHLLFPFSLLLFLLKNKPIIQLLNNNCHISWEHRPYLWLCPWAGGSEELLTKTQLAICVGFHSREGASWPALVVSEAVPSALDIETEILRGPPCAAGHVFTEMRWATLGLKDPSPTGVGNDSWRGAHANRWRLSIPKVKTT